MASNVGWIKSYRKMREHWLWRQPRVFSAAEAWIDLMHRAEYGERKHFIEGELVIIPRGSLLVTERELMKDWTWGKGKLRAFFTALETDGMLHRAADRKKTVLTLLNYGKHQDEDERERTDREPQTDRQRTGDGPQTDHTQTGAGPTSDRSRTARGPDLEKDLESNNSSKNLEENQELTPGARVEFALDGDEEILSTLASLRWMKLSPTRAIDLAAHYRANDLELPDLIWALEECNRWMDHGASKDALAARERPCHFETLRGWPLRRAQQYHADRAQQLRKLHGFPGADAALDSWARNGGGAK